VFLFVVEQNLGLLEVEATLMMVDVGTLTSTDAEEPKTSVEVEETMTLHKDVSS